MMQFFSFGISTILALVGIVVAEFKPTADGLVLIFGAGVFATLYMGTR
jgi:hypothetical protein